MSGHDSDRHERARHLMMGALDGELGSEERAELDALKGEGSASWGNQMRSYVLHPYQMVKDLRTEYEVGNPSAVLDGDIDGFLEAGIRWRNRRDED